MANSNNSGDDPVLRELIAIKQLLIVALLRDGVQQSHIARALGVSDATISRLFPKDLIKTIKTANDAER